MPDLPTGTVTFLFTDIEGSTRLLKNLGDRYADVLAAHQRLLREAFEGAGGHEIDTQGDAFFVAFRRAKDAVAAALTAQSSLGSHPWPNGQPVRVRMGIHTSEPAVGGERYVGLGVHRAARVCAAGHGGQVLLSGATRELVEEELPPGVGLRDLGEHRLKDLDRPEHIFQLVGDGLGTDFPPLKTLAAQPVAASPFAGREGELAAAAEAAVAQQPLRRRRLLFMLAALVLVAAIGATVLFVVMSGSPSALSEVPPNTVGVIDPASNKIVDAIGVNESPGPISVTGDGVWVLNQNSRTVSKIDVRTQKVVDNFGIGETRAYGFAATEGGIFVTGLSSGNLTWTGLVGESTSIQIGDENVFGAGIGLALDGDDVWVANQRPPRLIRVDSSALLTIAGTSALEHEPSALAVGGGFVWIANRDGSVSRFDPVSKETTTIPVGDRATAIAFGANSLWVIVGTGLAHVSLQPLEVERRVRVGRNPVAVAIGENDIWIADASGGMVLRIDALTGNVEARVHVGHRPQGIAIANGLVWVTVRR